jgi:hypothetical protein
MGFVFLDRIQSLASSRSKGTFRVMFAKLAFRGGALSEASASIGDAVAAAHA